MKNLFIFFAFCFLGTQLTAQLNVSLVGSLEYNEDLNDIWGYRAPDSTEYALVGVTDGFSIVSLADPANPTEVAFIPGDESIWRDIKTFGEYAYITTDEGNDGLLVVDMTDLPNSVESYFFKPTLLNGTIERCHNLYIDEQGYMYLAGCNINNGGVLIYDVFTDPYNPVFVNNTPGGYAHDVFTKDDIMYSSNLDNGLRIFDVTDKNDLVLKNITTTPFNFTHNAWATDDNSVVFTTDELANAPVGAYDVTDLDDVKELDQFRPSNTLGEGVVPHNAHVWGDYVIVSYYSDGCIILDATHPDNLIEVGNFDTYIPNTTGFNGAWGAYPYLPSGLILVSDIQSGLYVLEPNYIQGCYLEGAVTDITDNSALNNVSITINSGAPNFEQTDVFGTYKTGQATAGTFEVTFTKPGYFDLTTSAVFENGMITFLNVQMTPKAIINITGIALRNEDDVELDNVAVFALSDQGQLFNTISNSDGTFSLENIFEGDYQFYAGKWGYFHKAELLTLPLADNTVTLKLDIGYQDDFFFDFNWTTSGNAETGEWELGVPDGTFFQGQISNPNVDVEGDLGQECYVTENSSSNNVGAADVDAGETILTSPIMDLTIYNQPIVSYRTWFFNDGGDGNPNDDYIISISNGTDTVVLETITESLSEWRTESSFVIPNFISVTDSMTIIATTQDQGEGHLVEAGFDAFIVNEGMPTATSELEKINIEFEAFPNPFEEVIKVNINLNDNIKTAQLQVTNILGQVMDIFPINSLHQFEVGKNWDKGIYFLSIEVEGKMIETHRVVKQ